MSGPQPAFSGSTIPERESIFHHVVDLTLPLATRIPQVPRLCEDIATLEEQRISVGDCELYVETEGRGDPLVLINGGPGGTHHDFHPHFFRAAEHARVVYYDQRGCGLSDYVNGGGYTVSQAVEDLDALREALGFDAWTVLGWSYGGFLAQKYLIEHPKRVNGLVLVGALPAIALKLEPTRQQEFISSQEAKRIAEIHSDPSVPLALRVYNAHRCGDWKRQYYYKDTPEGLARNALYEWTHAEDFRQEILSSESYRQIESPGVFRGCPVPVLIAEGRWDLTWNTDKPEKLAGCFDDAELVLFEASGHGPFKDEPDRFFPMLEGFMAKLPPVDEAAAAAWKEHAARLLSD